jgi:hypothetical protein
MGDIAKMTSGDIEIDFEEMKKERRKNFSERIWFIKYWVNYIKTHSAVEWSGRQADFIDSQFLSAESFWRELKEKDPEKFEEMKRLRLRVGKSK